MALRREGLGAFPVFFPHSPTALFRMKPAVDFLMSKWAALMATFPTKWRANEQQGEGGSHQPVKFKN